MLLRNINNLEKVSVKKFVKFVSINLTYKKQLKQFNNKSQFLYFNNFKMRNNVSFDNQKRQIIGT